MCPALLQLLYNINSVLITILHGRYYCRFYFIDEHTKACGGEMALPTVTQLGSGRATIQIQVGWL